tara:strand:+ start:67066 stop:68430 length:1365 start_codon:yes stop_codon:yes gene_type:complete
MPSLRIAAVVLLLAVLGLAKQSFAEPSTPPQTEDSVDTTPDANSGASSSEYDNDVQSVEELLGEQYASEVEEERIQIYGFADFTYRYLSFADDSLWNLRLPNHGTFLLGNLNLYVRGNISSRWTSLAEVRFTFLPNGGQVEDVVVQSPPVDSEFRDDVDPADTVRVGGIIIERAWLQYRLNAHLKIRMGRWLTPYGIWNIDHGSPTVIGVRKPFIVGSDFMPGAQTGIQLLGEYRIDDYRLKYFATLANGRGPTDEYRDLDGNKALGASLKLATPWLDEFTVGTAANYGRDSETHAETIVSGATIQDVAAMTVIDRESNVLSVTGDLRLRWKNVLLIAEIASQQTAYTGRGRPTHFVASNALQADSIDVGGYALLGYELPWQHTILWSSYELASVSSKGVDLALSTVGVVIRPLPQVTLKASAFQLAFDQQAGVTSFLPPDKLSGFNFQMAWVF